MPISITTLNNASNRYYEKKSIDLREATSLGLRTIFLCHSHLDETLVKGVIYMLNQSGWKVYMDWADASMPETPNSKTAERIKQKIVTLDYFIFLATSNSTKSRWCPWEIGYADGKKHIDKILILPTTDNINTYGNEYLQLYRRIDMSNQNQLAVWKPGENNSISINQL